LRNLIASQGLHTAGIQLLMGSVAAEKWELENMDGQYSSNFFLTENVTWPWREEGHA
jgi:hypothetical protein